MGRRKLRITLGRAAATVAVAGLGAALLSGGLTPAPSVEPTVQAFLLAWQQRQYTVAASLTSGAQPAAGRFLADVYRQLDATGYTLRIGQISQDGDAAAAYFDASVNLGSDRLQWDYRSRLVLHRTGGIWKVDWSPAAIVPGLHIGQRLDLLTAMPSRAPVLDAAGRSLSAVSQVQEIGVRPDQLTDPAATARALARIARLPADQVAAITRQITAAPSAAFLELVRLQPAAYRRIRAALHRIPGLVIKTARTQLFDSIAPAVTGTVGTETAAALAPGRPPYRPGATVGLSGLQQAYQRTLTGTPTTEIVVEGTNGSLVQVLHRWSGTPGTAVRTTLSSAVQRDADRALAGFRSSAAIVAVRAGSGQILAVAEHQGAGLPPVRPLDGQYQPAQTFTIISTAALLVTGFRVSTPIPCHATDPVGGQVFSNDPEPHLGAQPPFSSDFAHGCATAFAGLSRNLTSRSLMQAATGFGIGASWRLPLTAFTGSMAAPSGEAQLAADTIGAGSVLVSPLDMALAAAVVQSGSWHPPELVTGLPGPSGKSAAPVDGQVVSSLRLLMRQVVVHGAGSAANAGRSAQAVVSGQVGGVSLTSGGQHVRASWFVGFRGDIAFAVLVFAKSARPAAASLAGRFARGLRPGS